VDRYIFHIIRRGEWLGALERGDYVPPSLGSEGFIHCSTAGQVSPTAKRWFAGVPDLLVLRIDTELLTAELKYEAPRNGGPERQNERFPHLYGTLNLNAVVEVLDLPGDGA
jgi:uncharacterized protein (DUF952 family)